VLLQATDVGHPAGRRCAGQLDQPIGDLFDRDRLQGIAGATTIDEGR
jgi:hypothetical protein